MAPPSELPCRRSNCNTVGLAKISGNNKHCVVVKSITRKPLLFLQTLSSQHVCSRRGFPRLKLRELSGLSLLLTGCLHAPRKYLMENQDHELVANMRAQS